MSTTAVDVARRYLELSNSGDLQSIFEILSDNIFYTSSSAGEFVGKESVEAMMTGFFAKFQKPHWAVESVIWDRDKQAVQFDFVMTAPEVDKNMRRVGREWIWVNDSGKIVKVEVQV